MATLHPTTVPVVSADPVAPDADSSPYVPSSQSQKVRSSAVPDAMLSGMQYPDTVVWSVHPDQVCSSPSPDNRSPMSAVYADREPHLSPDHFLYVPIPVPSPSDPLHGVPSGSYTWQFLRIRPDSLRESPDPDFRLQYPAWHVPASAHNSYICGSGRKK